MSEQNKQWIGIDVCQDYLDIAIHPEGKTFRLANDAPGQAELVQKLSSLSVEGIVLEATGGIERAVMSALETAGYQTRRVNPLQIRHFARAAGKLAKTDKIDAEMIAHFGQSLQPPVTLLPDAQCAVQHNSVFRDHYAQLLQRGKPRKVALVACIRKLLGILKAMLRTNQPWRDPVPPANGLPSASAIVSTN